MSDGIASDRPATVAQTVGVTGDVAALNGALEKDAYLDWSAIIGGTVVALAIAFVLLSFGSAVGLSAVSPWTSTRATITAVSWGAVLWLILVQIWSFGLGGYLAARMRHRHGGAAQTEIEFRDGAHGLLVWGLAVTSGAIVAALVAASIARGAMELSTSAMNDPRTLATDTLLRGIQPATHEEIGRVLANSSGAGNTVAADRAYLTQVVAARTGMPPAEAERRVDATIAQLKDAANHARRAAVAFGFLTAATLLLGAAAAWWAASVGGRHREQGTLWHGLTRHSLPSSLWSK
jgi:hypothetical protein